MHDGRNNELTWPMERVEARLGRPLVDELRQRYVEQEQTLDQIADALGVSAPTVSRWMRRLGVESRFPGRRKVA